MIQSSDVKFGLYLELWTRQQVGWLANVVSAFLVWDSRSQTTWYGNHPFPNPEINFLLIIPKVDSW